MIPRNDLPRFRETSPLSPARDSGSMSRMYLGVTRTADRAIALANKASQLSAMSQAGGLPGFSIQTGNFYPFKIYTPTNLSSFLFSTSGQTVPMVTTTGGALVPCQLINGATNLAANPPQLNIAETWRFWAVRWGWVETRPIYSTTNLAGNMTYLVVPQYVDFYEANEPANNPVTPDSSNTNPSGIIALGVNPEPTSNSVSASLWIQVIPDTSSAALPTAQIQGVCYYSSSPPYDVTIPAPFNPTTNNQIPIGYLFGNAPAVQAYSLIFDHARNRFPCGNGNFGGNGNGTVMNFRGTISYNSTANTAVVSPSDLLSQVMYPGDVIWFYSYFTSGSGGINHNRQYSFVGATPAQFNQSFAYPNPIGDANWTSTIPVDLGTAV
jgi:hypothetical protein